MESTAPTEGPQPAQTTPLAPPWEGLPKSPTVAALEAMDDQQRRVYLDDPKALPTKAVGCRHCAHAVWMARERTLIAYCKQVHQTTWTPGIRASDGDVVTTICDGVIQLALLEDAKRRQEAARSEWQGASPAADAPAPTGNG